MTSIGDAAFASCTSLTTVTFPAESKLTVIGDYAFRCCRSLTKLAFPDGLIAVGKYAFLDCTSLTLPWPAPATLVSIGYSAFRGCPWLTELPNQPRRPHHHYRRVRFLLQHISGQISHRAQRAPCLPPSPAPSHGVDTP